MEKPYILHMITPMAHMSPFDINMACDAGYNVIVPYSHVEIEQVAVLTQDAIFSRGPKGAKRTGLFIGGREVGLALDMLEAARKAMVPPFEVSVFVDPSGAFTTAASMVACVERQMKNTHGSTLAGKRVSVFGGTGPVGAAAAVLVAQAGAMAGLVARADIERTRHAAAALTERFGVTIDALDATSTQSRNALIEKTDIALATAKAGIRVLSKDDLDAAKRLLVAADVNAVPPSGIEGIGAMDDGKELAAASARARGVGALAIGNIKYQTEKSMFEAMLQADKARYLGMREILDEARKHAGLS